MTLYEIDNAILSCLDEETGEVIDLDKLDELSIARETKLESVALWVKNLDAEAKAIREEEKLLAERRKQKEAKADRLKEFLTDHLGGQKFETPKVKLSFRSSKRTVVDDLDLLMAELEGSNSLDCCIKYTAPAPNLTAVGKKLKEGFVIPGVHIEDAQNLQIK